MKLNYIKLDKEMPEPSYARVGDIAFDLRTAEDDYLLKPMETKVFKTGLKIEIPPGYVGNIRDRSGLPAK